MEQERNSDKEKETRKEMEDERNPEKQMPEESDAEEEEDDTTSPTKMVAKPEGDDDAKKLIKKEPDPRCFYHRRSIKFVGPMLVGSSSHHHPGSREVIGEHAPLIMIIHNKKKKKKHKKISRMVDHRKQVGSLRRSHTLPPHGLVIGERTPPLSIHEMQKIFRLQESSSYIHQIRIVEPKDLHWYSRLCLLKIPIECKRFMTLACEEEKEKEEEELVGRAVLGAKDHPSIIDSMCPFCGEDVETVLHCLWECSNPILVWSASPLSWLLLLLRASTFTELLCDAMRVLEDDYDLSLFVLICWYMWEARHGHEQEAGTAMDPDAIVNKALLSLGKKPPSRRPPNFYTCCCRIL